MVELCELPVMDCEEWPPDMDTHVAELDFARSVEESIFSSLDPQAISTDSLDTSLLHRRCANNKEDYRLTLLEDSGQWTASTAPLTTWGRIRSTEPLEETTTSMPLPVAATLPRQSKTRPTSLLATFQGFAPFVDVNENEMTAVDSASSPTRKTAADRWRQATRCRATPRRRTFAQLSEAPRLDFLALPHEMPELCEPELSLGEAMQRLKEGSLTGFERLPTCLLAEDSPDSGLGSSGPSHIEDWPSLALLLPRHVVEACSFFKSHSRLLASNSNSIERSSEACRTCFGVRRRLHPPAWAHAPSSRHLCDCGAEVEERAVCASPSLHTGELSIVGLPVYSEKRRLVETAVEGAAEMARGGSTADLVAALWKLIGDGLSPSRHVWEVISAGTAPGPATKGVHALVAELDSSEKSLNSRVDLFFQELLRLGLLDCWLCYIVLKDSSLRPFYSESAFLPKASTAYHSLLCRLVESLQLLAIFPPSTPRSLYSSASRLPSDSRVPKSSSMPARLSCSQWRRPSRIPRLRERPEWPRKTSQGPSGHGRMSEAKALRDSSEPGFLSVSSGESLRVLSFRGPLARVCRSRPRRDAVSTGLLPIANLSLV